MSVFEVLLCTIFCIILLSLLYFSRYYGYKLFFKKLNINPSGILELRVISFSFILWLLLGYSFALPELVNNEHYDTSLVVSVSLALFFFSLIMLIPYNLSKKYGVAFYKGFLLELILFAGGYILWVFGFIFCALGVLILYSLGFLKL